MFLEHFLNFASAWIKSRQWLPIAILTAGLALLPLVAFYLVISGVATPLNVMAADYQMLIDTELNAVDSDKNGAESRSLSRMLQVPLRRILQMDAANERVSYFVALQLAHQGRTGMAARMMRDIAPSGTMSGYPDAHAWLAAYALSGEIARDDLDLNELMHDLDIAIDQASSVGSTLIQAYAALLFRAERNDEALSLLRTKAPQFPELYVPYGELAKEMGESSDLKAAIRDGTDELEKRLLEGGQQERNVVLLVRLALLGEDVDKAVSISQEKLAKDPGNPVYRQVYSSALLAKYAALDENYDLGTRMQYLDAAFKANPSNEQVVAEVAKAIALGQHMPESLRTEVEDILADGKAPAVAHMILANSELTGDNPESAIVHLEFALRQLPNSAVVMNNLAIAILQARPEELDRAETLVEEALSQPNASAATLASILDTQGQVRLAREDLLGAIDSFVKAIGLDQSKVNTRRSLADAYQRVGMSDLAAAQTRRIAEQLEQEKTPAPKDL